MRSLQEVENRVRVYASEEVSDATGYHEEPFSVSGSNASSHLAYEVEFPSGTATVVVDPNGKLIRRRWRWS